MAESISRAMRAEEIVGMPDKRVLAMREVVSRLPVGLQRATLEEESDHDFTRAMTQLVLRLRAYVLSDHVETETHPVRFKRRVTVHDSVKVVIQRPAGKWQMIKFLLGAKRVHWAEAEYFEKPQGRSVWVEIQETVKIHREFTYPELKVTFPPEMMGRTFLFEHAEVPE